MKERKKAVSSSICERMKYLGCSAATFSHHPSEPESFENAVGKNEQKEMKEKDVL